MMMINNFKLAQYDKKDFEKYLSGFDVSVL